jgi:uncharacterized phage protein (TIGR01671 family)
MTKMPKFRAWDTHEQKMFANNELIIWGGNVYLDESQGLPCRNLKCRSIPDGYLMQSTGLCDKEGTEVFEGDILHHQIQTDYTFIVKYDKDNTRWYGDGLSRTYRIDITKDFLQYYKVIGNIYENQELLENKGEEK